MHNIQWRRPQVDLSELAKLRWIEKWSRARLAQKYGVRIKSIQAYSRKLRQGDLDSLPLSNQEKGKIKKAWKAHNKLILSL